MFESEAKSEAIDVNFSFFHANEIHFTKMFSFALKTRVFGTQGTPLYVVKKIFSALNFYKGLLCSQFRIGLRPKVAVKYNNNIYHLKLWGEACP